MLYRQLQRRPKEIRKHQGGEIVGEGRTETDRGDTELFRDVLCKRTHGIIEDYIRRIRLDFKDVVKVAGAVQLKKPPVEPVKIRSQFLQTVARKVDAVGMPCGAAAYNQLPVFLRAVPVHLNTRARKRPQHRIDRVYMPLGRGRKKDHPFASHCPLHLLPQSCNSSRLQVSPAAVPQRSTRSPSFILPSSRSAQST